MYDNCAARLLSIHLGWTGFRAAWSSSCFGVFMFSYQKGPFVCPNWHSSSPLVRFTMNDPTKWTGNVGAAAAAKAHPHPHPQRWRGFGEALQLTTNSRQHAMHTKQSVLLPPIHLLLLIILIIISPEQQPQNFACTPLHFVRLSFCGCNCIGTRRTHCHNSFYWI